MTTPNPNPAPAEPARSPAPPRITLESGRQYDDPVNFAKADLLLHITLAEGEDIIQDPATVAVVDGKLPGISGYPDNGHLLYGVMIDGKGIYGYPIKPGTYGLRVSVNAFTETDEGVKTYTQHKEVDCELVVTGVEKGRPYDREVLHHLHPQIDTFLANQSTLKEASDSTFSRIGKLETTVLEIEAQLADDGG